MAHVKRGTTTHARHKKVLKLAKGYRGRSEIAIVSLLNALKRHFNMLIVIVETGSTIPAPSGFSGLMLARGNMV